MKTFLNNICDRFEGVSYAVLLGVFGILNGFVFFIPFSYHNDGGLISGTKGDFLNGFFESGHDFMIGRPFQALFLGLQTSLTYNIWHLSLFRMFSFVLLGGAAYLFYLFLKQRLEVDEFCARAVSISIFFLPPSLVFLVWVQEIPTGSLVVLLAMVAYRTFDQTCLALSKKGITGRTIAGLILAAVLFLSSLCFYPPLSMIVFAFSFMYLVFGRMAMKSVRRIVLRDTFFFGFLMGVYAWLVKAVILPWGQQLYPSLPERQGLYRFSLSHSLAAKGGLLREVISLFAQGSFHLLQNPVSFLSLSLVVGIILWFRRREAKWSFVLGEKILWGGLLFGLANSPVLVAGGCFAIPGYRVLYPVGLMWLALLFRGLMKQGNINKFRVQGFLLFLVLLILATWTLHAVVRNTHAEYARIVKQIKAVDYANTNRVLFILRDPAHPFIPRKYSYDLGLLSTEAMHVVFYVNKYWPSSFPPPVIQHALATDTYYLSPETAVINLNQEASASPGEAVGPNAVYVDYSPKKPTWHLSANARSKNEGLLSFYEEKATGEKFPFWGVAKEESQAFFELRSKRPRKLKAYTCAVEEISSSGQRFPVRWVLQGSRDGAQWTNLDARSLSAPALKIFSRNMTITEPKAFSFYRLVWIKHQPQNQLRIYALRLLWEDGDT